MKIFNITKRNSLAVTLIALMCTSLVGGCSIIGLSVGVNADSEPGVIRPSQVDTLVQGSKMVLNMTDSQEIRGQFVGTEFDVPPRYVETYESIQRSNRDSIHLPSIGDNVTVTDIWGGIFAGEFGGFGLSSYSEYDNPQPLMYEEYPLFAFIKQRNRYGSLITTAVIAKEVKTMKGFKIDLRSVCSLISVGGIPVPSKWLILSNDRGMSRIDFKDVREFQVDETNFKSHYNWAIGLGIGAAFDVAAYFAMMSAFRSSFRLNLNSK